MSQGSLFDDDGPPPVLCTHCGEPIEWHPAERRWMHMPHRMSQCADGRHFAAPPMPEPEVAHARRGDPVTSHEAAASLESEAIRRSQLAVLGMFRRFGPMHDKQLIERYMLTQASSDLPKQSSSGIRTRRSELVAKLILEDSGEKIVLPDSHRRAIIWRVTANGHAG